MMIPGDCSMCCHQRVCTHEQLFWKDGAFRILYAECRATDGTNFCYVDEPSLGTIDPKDWFLWKQLERPISVHLNENIVDLTKTVIVPKPIWEDTDEVVSESVGMAQPKGHTNSKQIVKPSTKENKNTGTTPQALGLKKVCKSTNEAAEDWWNKMKSKQGDRE